MGLTPGQAGSTELVAQVARAIGAAQDELWPVRRTHQPRLRPEEMYGRAAAAALAVVRQAIGGLQLPRLLADDAGWEAYRLAVVRALGGAE